MANRIAISSQTIIHSANRSYDFMMSYPRALGLDESVSARDRYFVERLGSGDILALMCERGSILLQLPLIVSLSLIVSVFLPTSTPAVRSADRAFKNPPDLA